MLRTDEAVQDVVDAGVLVVYQVPVAFHSLQFFRLWVWCIYREQLGQAFGRWRSRSGGGCRAQMDGWMNQVVIEGGAPTIDLYVCSPGTVAARTDPFAFCSNLVLLSFDPVSVGRSGRGLLTLTSPAPRLPCRSTPSGVSRVSNKLEFW